MKAKEFAAMSAEDLTAKIADLKEELFNLRCRLATGQLDDVMQIQKVKRDIARALTVQTQSRKKA